MPEDQLIAGRYRLLSPLGEGGMGVVWRAHDEALAREVAVKEVRAPAGLSSADEHRLYQRLEREAWAAGRISHRGVVTVYDVATEGGRPWIVMELIRGLALSDIVEMEGPLAPERVAHIGAEILAALCAAHEAGVLHRDVKPGNVLIANDGRVVLSDFGIAVVEGTSNLTMTGELIGSPEFLAPERALGHTPGPASDLWSLGVLLHTTVEGASPFRRESALSTLRAVVDEEPPPPRLAGELAPVIAGLLRKNPGERLTAHEAARLLRVVAAGGTAPVLTVPTPSGPHTPSTHPPLVGAGFGSGGSGSGTTTVGGTAPVNGAQGEQPRRAVVVLAAGVALLLVVAGGLAWALVDSQRNSKSEARGTGTAVSSQTPGPTTGTAGTGGDREPANSGGARPSEGKGSTAPSATQDSRPPQRVEVSVSAVRAGYSGYCAPPPSAAPAFRATVSVARTPATVRYRWTTESGRTSADGWQTLWFTDGDARQQRVEHTELTHEAEGTHRDRIRVEVRDPVEARSGWISFSVDCEPAAPTGGASSSADASGVAVSAVTAVSRWR